jgi:hypothetical protein
MVLARRLEALTRFLPDFERPGFEFGHWIRPTPDRSGIHAFPSYSLSETGSAFVKAAYDNAWVTQFDWMEWIGTPEAKRLLDDEEALATASPTHLEHLLTALIRQDRFVEGALGDAFQSGVLTRILRRAEFLLGNLARGGA